MNALLLGVSKDSLALAKMIQKANENTSENQIVIDGVYCRDISQTTMFAMSLNIKAYVSIEDALRNCDILFIAPPDSKLLRFTEGLKEYRIRNKILCHFSDKYDSTALYGGTTNTCYSINLPYGYDAKTFVCPPDAPIIVQGSGKKDEIFRATLENTIHNPVVYAGNTEKGIAAQAKRIMTCYTKVCVKTAMHLFKIAGIYHKDSFRYMCTHIMDEIAENPDNIPKLDATTLKKNRKLLANLNYDDTDEFVRNMEVHIMRTSEYSQEEKQDIARVLHCKYR